jgi:hypothetical protein
MYQEKTRNRRRTPALPDERRLVLGAVVTEPVAP